MKIAFVLIAFLLVGCAYGEEEEEEEKEENTEPKCFDMCKYNNDVLAHFFNESQVRKCTRFLSGNFVPKGLYKMGMKRYALNDEAKDVITEMVDTCGEGKNSKFFPCMVDAVDEKCPEMKDIYRKEVKRLGYDV